MEWGCFWVNLREDNKVSESKDGSVWIQHGRIQDGCHHQFESEWMSECFFVQMVGTNLGKCEWVWEENTNMAESKMARIQDGRIQDSWHHQVKWELMSLSQIELVWVSIRVEWECFGGIWEKITKCLNPRWQCLNPTWQNSRWLLASTWVRMNEWSFFLGKWWEPILASVSEFERK